VRYKNNKDSAEERKKELIVEMSAGDVFIDSNYDELGEEHRGRECDTRHGLMILPKIERSTLEIGVKCILLWG